MSQQLNPLSIIHRALHSEGGKMFDSLSAVQHRIIGRINFYNEKIDDINRRRPGSEYARHEYAVESLIISSKIEALKEVLEYIKDEQ